MIREPGLTSVVVARRSQGLPIEAFQRIGSGWYPTRRSDPAFYVTWEELVTEYDYVEVVWRA